MTMMRSPPDERGAGPTMRPAPNNPDDESVCESDGNTDVSGSAGVDLAATTTVDATRRRQRKSVLHTLGAAGDFTIAEMMVANVTRISATHTEENGPREGGRGY